MLRPALPPRSALPCRFRRIACNSTAGFTSKTPADLSLTLAQLGVSHCYASPILKARAGSQHGYDIIDHKQLNPEIGTEEEFRQLVAELKVTGMGLHPRHSTQPYGSRARD